MDTPTTNNPLAREEIAKHAYDIWEACGRPPGREVEFWLRAENELRKDRQQAEECRCGLGHPAEPTRSS